MLEVILRTDIENLGRAGEIVAVKPGYARNFLIPQGLALQATPGNRKRFAEEREQVTHAQVREREHADELALELEGRSLTFTVRAGEDGKLFGSVTSPDIAEALAAEGTRIDRHDIVLEEPIKELGVYRVPIRLHADVLPEVRVWVVARE
jgi:large subunit ribosomal protein L9